MSDKPLSIHKILHMLRNPFGYSHEQMRTARNDAADELERLQGDGVDAQRYRWLRNDSIWTLFGDPGGWKFTSTWDAAEGKAAYSDGDVHELDAAIDAEIAAETDSKQ